MNKNWKGVCIEKREISLDVINLEGKIIPFKIDETKSLTAVYDAITGLCGLICFNDEDVGLTYGVKELKRSPVEFRNVFKVGYAIKVVDKALVKGRTIVINLFDLEGKRHKMEIYNTKSLKQLYREAKEACGLRYHQVEDIGLVYLGTEIECSHFRSMKDLAIDHNSQIFIIIKNVKLDFVHCASGKIISINVDKTSTLEQLYEIAKNQFQVTDEDILSLNYNGETLEESDMLMLNDIYSPDNCKIELEIRPITHFNIITHANGKASNIIIDKNTSLGVLSDEIKKRWGLQLISTDEYVLHHEGDELDCLQFSNMPIQCLGIKNNSIVDLLVKQPGGLQ